jgi:hypothetical protein
MNSFEKVIEELKQYEPQRIDIADIPKTLRFGWKIYSPEKHFTVRLESAKATWPKALFELAFAEKGREALRDLLYEKAWGIK